MCSRSHEALACMHARTCMCTHCMYCVHAAMASKVVEEGSCYEWPSYIRGYHDYQAKWTPSVREMLILKVEPTNHFDDFAVSVVKDGTVVGHVPKYVSRVVCYFLKKVGSVGFLK